jgi:hypothetical protein
MVPSKSFAVDPVVIGKLILMSVVGTNPEPSDAIHLVELILFLFCLPMARLPQLPLIARTVK